ncbi:hypothetical protein GCM10010304_76570 [Streptomyces roseoviolaceus]
MEPGRGRHLHPGRTPPPIRTGKGRCPHPVTLIVDSQSVKAASTVGKDSRGYDAAKKVNGRK